MGSLIDLTGQKFSRLTVIERAGKDKGDQSLWLCKCLCGQEKTVRGGDLKTKRTKSCGCLLRERNHSNNPPGLKHGHARAGCLSRLYKTWDSMKYRCLNPNHKYYSYYGGANPPVTVCDRWLSFENFLEDMGPRPVGTSLGRFGDTGPYEKSNCAWQNSAEQVANRRPDRKMRGASKKKIVEQIAA
jgi:hypothetical protein